MRTTTPIRLRITTANHSLRGLYSQSNLPRSTDNSLLYTAEEKILYCINALDVQDSELIEQVIAKHDGNPTLKEDEPSSEEAFKRQLYLLKLHQQKNSLHSIIERRPYDAANTQLSPSTQVFNSHDLRPPTSQDKDSHSHFGRLSSVITVVRSSMLVLGSS
jgi:hypothetical protein